MNTLMKDTTNQLREWLFIVGIVLGVLGIVTACSDGPEVIKLDPTIQEKIVEIYKIDLNKFPTARDEVAEAVHNCGPGVVPGVPGENRCGYQLQAIDDEIFLRHTNGKTGLLHDEDEMLQEGVTFYLPPQDIGIPDRFDLRDFMVKGKPEIKQQQCGDCWAWATHHGLEISRAVHDPASYDHSVQTVLSCSKAGSCGGGYMSAVQYLLKGLPFESGFPYLNGSTGKCKFSESEQSWEPKVQAAPYIGDSLQHSRAKVRDGQMAEGPKVYDMMRAMVQWKSPLVVTVSAYSVGNGVYDSCGAINSGGNHMVAISGFEMWNGKRVAHVWNSWGTGFGGSEGQGVGKQVWECGDGKLNRGLGVSARIVQYKAPCTPAPAVIGFAHKIILEGSSMKMGQKQPAGVTCEWLPESGLSDPKACETFATPDKSTEYHLKVKTPGCGETSAMALLEVWGPNGRRSNVVVTPFGEGDWLK